MPAVCLTLPRFFRGSRAGALAQGVEANADRQAVVLYATSEVGMISRATPDQHESFPKASASPLPA